MHQESVRASEQRSLADEHDPLSGEESNFPPKPRKEYKMSLKFGIYLVEQRVISAEQFCGLVKIQQESSQTMATIALRKNLMTIRQVNYLLDEMDSNPGVSFEELALQKGLIDSQDMNIMRQSKEVSCPPIRSLLVECGLLTRHQTNVLFEHFEKMGQSTVQHNAAKATVSKPYMNNAPAPAQQPSPTTKASPASPQASPAMPQPKFQQRRPVIQKHTAN